MEIVVLDGYTANAGDLSWEPIQALGETDIYDRSPANTLIDRCRGKEAVLINKVVLDAQTLAQLPELRYIGYLATGYNTVDLEAANKQGITVCNAQGYSSQSVAQHTIAMLLNWSNEIATHTQSVQQGDWLNAADWTYRKTPLIELAGKTLGIIGLGNIGLQTAKIAMAMGMHVIAYNPSSRPSDEVEWVELEDIFLRSDVVSLHCPLSPQNEGMINRSRLGKMKKTALLINTARGGLIQEQELTQALKEGEIAGAALDVLSTEPPLPNNPLLSAPNCRITPHIAWATVESRNRLLEIVGANLAAFINGNPQSVVNRPLL
ncbi:MAG: D-2-hydroxyacid dehydrogenase [Bacteroidota bacterium]